MSQTLCQDLIWDYLTKLLEQCKLWRMVQAPVWTLGDRLRKSREVAGMTREEMADRLGTTKASVWNWENDVSKPRDVLATTQEWADLTQVEVEWIRSRCSSFDW